MPAHIETYGQLENTEKPWWANKIETVPTWPPNSPWQAVCRVAGLDWGVGLQNVYEYQGRAIPGFQSVVRETDQTVLHIAKERDLPVQNKTVFQEVDSLVNGHLQFHTAGSLDGGKVMWALAKLSEQMRVVGHDVIDQYVLAVNAHDGSKRVSLARTPVRVVCQNTLKQAELRREHAISQPCRAPSPTPASAGLSG